MTSRASPAGREVVNPLAIPVQTFETIDSTNDVAKRLYHQGRLRETTLILAEAQTAGRGTQGRTWVSPKGGWYGSLAFPSQALEAVSAQWPITLWAGQLAQSTLKDAFGLATTLKGVNDLMVGDRKLGGILTESILEDGQLTFLVVGLGLNLYPLATPLPDQRNQPISLQEALQNSVTEECIAIKLDFSSARSEFWRVWAQGLKHRFDRGF